MIPLRSGVEMRIATRFRGIPLVTLWALGLLGCGYQSGNMMPGGIEAVAVESFGNETLYRRAEITYHRSLSRELVRRAGVTIREPHQAQAVIRGRILEIPRVVLVEDDDDRILEGGVIVRIEVRFEDPRSGAPIIPPFVVIRRAEHIIPRGESLQFAIDEALQEAARDTVDRLQAEAFLRSRAPAQG